MKKVYKKQYYTNNDEAYRLFLKKHFLRIIPTYYAIVGKKTVTTISGNMFVLKLSLAIEDPNCDVIAETVINSELIYLWHNHCWAVATDTNNKPIYKTGHDGHKVLMIYKIGIDEVN